MRVDLANRLALTLDETAVVLGISRRKLDDIVRELPTLRVGSRVLVSVEGLRKWVDECACGERIDVDAVVDAVVSELR
jgi:excisionase family DNA binding protein